MKKITKLLDFNQYKSARRVPKTPMIITDYELYIEADSIIKNLKKKLGRRNMLIAILIPAMGAMAWVIKERCYTTCELDCTEFDDEPIE